MSTGHETIKLDTPHHEIGLRVACNFAEHEVTP